MIDKAFKAPASRRRGPPPDHSKCGLWVAVVTNRELNVGAWTRADANAEIVGTCRACGGYLVPDSPPDYAEYGIELPVRWFEAKCLSCAHVVASPDGRLCDRAGRSTTRRRG